MAYRRAPLPALLLAAAVAGGEGTARGAPARHPFDVALDAPAGCPSADTFAHEVEARAPSAHSTEGAETVLRVTVTRRAPVFAGELALPSPAGPLVRRIEGRSCREVVSALALVAAMTLEGGRSEEAAHTPDAASGGGTEATTGTGAPGAVVTSSTSPAVTPKPRENQPAATAEEESADHAPRTVRLEVGVGGDLLAAGPSPVGFGGHAFFGLRDSRDFALGWDVRVHADQTLEATAKALGQGVGFTRSTAGLDVCPLGMFVGIGRWSACARGDAGVLRAESSGVPGARTTSRPWGDAGAMTRLRVALVGPLFADAEAAILASLVRDRFVFEPNETVYRAAPLSFTASIDVGASF